MRAGPILLYVVGIAIFCAMDATLKKLVQSNPALMATFWRYVSAIVFTLLIWWRDGRPGFSRVMLPFHILRGSIVAFSAFLFFWALREVPLAQAVTIAFIAPLLIPIVAAGLLRERLQSGSIVAGLLGFVGVLVAVGLDPADWQRSQMLGVAALLGSAITYALAVVIMRRLAATDGASVVSVLGALIPALALLPFLLLLVPPQMILPRGESWLWVLLAGLFGAVGLQLLARAYAEAEAQVLAPFEYTALFWAALYGWLFFSEPVALRTWAGAAIIGGACLWQARRSRPQASSSPAA